MRSTIRNKHTFRSFRRHCCHHDRDLYKCGLCGNNHSLRFCRRFLHLSPAKRQKVVDQYNYCSNCLAKSHDMRGCPSMNSCRKCGMFHHTLLHPSTTRNKREKSIHTADLRQRQQHRHQQQQERCTEPRETASKSTTSDRKSSPSVASSDTKIIVDAIRSLATILSGSCKNSSSA